MFGDDARWSAASVATLSQKEQVECKSAQGPAATEMQGLDALLWEAIVQEDERADPVVNDLRKGLRVDHATSNNIVPAMPVVTYN